MSTRPRLVRSIPFWGLIVVSLGTAAAGAVLLIDKLGSMATVLTAGTATPVDVYVGQSVAIVGAVLLGAGVVGVLLAFGIAAAATLRPHASVEIVEPVGGEAEEAVDAASPEHGYERGLGYTEAIDTAASDAEESSDERTDEVEAPAPTR